MKKIARFRSLTGCGGLFTFLLVGAVALFSSGCASSRTVNLAAIKANWHGPTIIDLSSPVYDAQVKAVVDPPIGWKPQPLKENSSHTHETWLSPDGQTAYGVIHFSLPFPVGKSLAFKGFIDHMKKSEGQADVLSKTDDPNLPGYRFVAEGGLYTIRTNFIISGWEGWAIYAGTIRNKPVNAEQLDMAERARDHTKVGEPTSSSN